MARLTYADYLRLPPDRRWELVDGQPHAVPSPNTRHQDVLGTLLFAIFGFVEERGSGDVLFIPFDVVLSDFDVVQPDIFFISDADEHVLTDDDTSFQGPPTWVIEILSNPYYERDKLRRYETFGVPEYWLINPYEDSLGVFVHDGSRYATPETFEIPARVRPLCLPDLEIDLNDVLGPSSFGRKSGQSPIIDPWCHYPTVVVRSLPRRSPLTGVCLGGKREG